MTTLDDLPEINSWDRTLLRCCLPPSFHLAADCHIIRHVPGPEWMDELQAAHPLLGLFIACWEHGVVHACNEYSGSRDDISLIYTADRTTMRVTLLNGRIGDAHIVRYRLKSWSRRTSLNLCFGVFLAVDKPDADLFHLMCLPDYLALLE